MYFYSKLLATKSNQIAKLKINAFLASASGEPTITKSQGYFSFCENRDYRFSNCSLEVLEGIDTYKVILHPENNRSLSLELEKQEVSDENLGLALAELFAPVFR